jgi:hypothetical protein
MSETERSDEPIVQSMTDMGVSEGRHIHAQVNYVPPLDGDDDLFAQVDVSVAKDIYAILTKHYFGYEWKTYADIRQGVVGFQIPELMGPTLHMVINLKQFADLTEKLIMRHGGELLDRMHLPTDRFGMEEYLKAKFNKRAFEFGRVQ